MDMQLVLRVIGIVALVVSALFAALAVHYYLTRDIRAVMDDLSGKTRARGVAGVRRTAAIDRRRETTRRSAASPVEAAAEQLATAERPATAEQPAMAGALGATPIAPAGAIGVAPNAPAQVDDEPETMIEPDEALDATELSEDAVPPVVGMEAPGAAVAGAYPRFQVTRRVVHMSAAQVIAVSEGAGR